MATVDLKPDANAGRILYALEPLLSKAIVLKIALLSEGFASWLEARTEKSSL